MRAPISSLVLSLCTLCALAQDQAPKEVRFPISSYQVEGATAVSVDELQKVLVPFTGDAMNFQAIEGAVSAIKHLYSDRGYSAIQVVLPEQDVTSKFVRLKVIEAKVARIAVGGNTFFDEANIRATVPELKLGEVPNIDLVGTGIRLANESPAKQTRLTLKQSEKPDEVDALVQVADANPVKQFVWLDDSGDSATGRFRLGYGAENANVFNRDHVASVILLTSPDHVEDVGILGVNYHAPFYGIGGAVDLSLSHSSVNSGTLSTAAGSYSISGNGDVFGLKYTQLLSRLGEWDQRAVAGYEYRFYGNNVLPVGGSISLIPDLVAQPLTLTYAGFSKANDRQWGATVSFSQNLSGGYKNSTQDYQASGARAHAEADYQIWRLNLNLTQPVGAWLLKASMSAQDTQNALIAGEQFGLGGADSVRGFSEREVVNDRGYRTSLEVQSPQIYVDFTESKKLQMRALVFYDSGEVWRNLALPSEITYARVASAGLGLRANYGTQLQLKLDLASVVAGAASRKEGDIKVHANLLYLF